jgi:large subunit ribosomal protein L10
MENPRPEKVAVVNEVRQRLDGSAGAILTEYRGLTVRELAALREALAAAGGDYKVYKNTLVKLAIAGGRHESLEALLQGPTGIAFVSGEVSAVAKALRDYARTNPALIVKGGLHGEGLLSAQELAVLADLPSRDVLLARLAGAIAAPMQQLAGLLQALPRSFAYGLSALLDQKGGAPAEAAAEPEAAAAEPEASAPAEAPAETETPSETEAAAEPEASAAPEASVEAAPAPEAEAAPEPASEPETSAEAAGSADAEPTAESETPAEAESAPEASAEAADQGESGGDGA